MAVPHIRLTAQSRANGDSAVAKAAYDSCSILRDSGQAFDYRKKRGLVHQELIFADGEPHQSRGAFWRDVERLEKRYDACVSREIVFALPCELDQAARLELAQEMSQTILRNYEFKAVDLCIHNPPPDRRKRNADKSQENPHCHLHIPTRNKNGKKLRQFNGPGGVNPEEVKKIRKIFEEITNRYLKNAGLKTKISVETIEKQLEENKAKQDKNNEIIKALQQSQEISPLYVVHYDDLKKICKPDVTEEDINFRIACRLRATEHSQEETASIIYSFTGNENYSVKAAQAAFTSKKAEKDLKKLKKWIPNWKQLEKSIMPGWEQAREMRKCQELLKNLTQSVKPTMTM